MGQFTEKRVLLVVLEPAKSLLWTDVYMLSKQVNNGYAEIGFLVPPAFIPRFCCNSSALCMKTLNEVMRQIVDTTIHTNRYPTYCLQNRSGK